MNARRTIIAALGIGAIIAFGALGLRFFASARGPAGSALVARREAMRQLGERITKLKPGTKALVLANPFAKDSGFFDEKRRFEQAAVEGLIQGFGSASNVKVVLPQLRPEYLANPQSVVIPPDTRTPLSFLVQAGSVEQLADANPDHRVIVSLIGLPMEIDQLKIWAVSDVRSFALLEPDLRLLGAPETAALAFENGKILAAVAEDPASAGAPLVITRENIRTVLQKSPKALGY